MLRNKIRTAGLLATASAIMLGSVGTASAGAEPSSSTNVASSAVVTSSGSTFPHGQTASKAVDGVIDGWPGDYTKEWAVTDGGPGTWIRMKWAKSVNLNKIVLFDRPNSDDQITGGTLVFSDGSSVVVPALNNDGTATTVTFAGRNVTSIRFNVTSVSKTTRNPGLAELQTWTSSGSATPTTNPPATGGDANGSMPVGDLPGWKQIFTDDFTTDAPLGTFNSKYSQKWFSYNAGTRDTSGNLTYDSSKVTSVSNGVMDQYLHTENGTHYGNALVAINPTTRWGSTYGRYSIRMKSDNIPGYKAVIMLWPDSDIWNEGEVDFPEVNTLTPGETSKANVYLDGRWQNFTTNSQFTNGWHTYTTEWTPNRLTFYIDGTAVATTTKDVPTKPMHYVLQYESQITGGPPANATAGHISVDWVTMYTPK